MKEKTLGAVVISRNDGYGGDQPMKLTYCLTALLAACDEVVYVDWNSPNGVTVIDLIRNFLPATGKLKCITVTTGTAAELTNHSLDTQLCVEVMARNIGLRRLNTDWKISTNGDILVLDRDSILAGIRDEQTFHCIARRETPFAEVRGQWSGVSGSTESVVRHAQSLALTSIAKFGQHGSGSPLGARDPWSLITCPGDFQMAHRDLWSAIRGYEETLLMRGYTDSNVQRKAADAGFKLELVRDIPVFHFTHYPGTGASGGTHNSGWNDAEKSLFQFPGTTNKETWGFSDQEFPTEII